MKNKIHDWQQRLAAIHSEIELDLLRKSTSLGIPMLVKAADSSLLTSIEFLNVAIQKYQDHGIPAGEEEMHNV